MLWLNEFLTICNYFKGLVVKNDDCGILCVRQKNIYIFVLVYYIELKQINTGNIHEYRQPLSNRIFKNS